VCCFRPLRNCSQLTFFCSAPIPSSKAVQKRNSLRRQPPFLLKSQVGDLYLPSVSQRFIMKKAIKSLRASIPPQRKPQQSLPKTEDVEGATPAARAVVLQNSVNEATDSVIPSTPIEPTNTPVHSSPVELIPASSTSNVTPTSLVDNDEHIGDKPQHSSEEGCPVHRPIR
jgi:hypothetical protein